MPGQSDFGKAHCFDAPTAVSYGQAKEVQRGKPVLYCLDSCVLIFVLMSTGMAPGERIMNAKLMVALVCVVVLGIGCQTRPQTVASRNYLSDQVQESVALFKIRDPGIQAFFDRSYGYAVLPKIGKGAVIVGGAHGKGEVFAQGTRVGFCSMSQASVGFSFGGEFFREIIFFRDQMDLGPFPHGRLHLLRPGDRRGRQLRRRGQKRLSGRDGRFRHARIRPDGRRLHRRAEVLLRSELHHAGGTADRTAVNHEQVVQRSKIRMQN